jgi:hypothetical protein
MHPVLVHTPCSIGMSHVAEFSCCSSVAFERPNKHTFTFKNLVQALMQAPLSEHHRSKHSSLSSTPCAALCPGLCVRVPTQCLHRVILRLDGCDSHDHGLAWVPRRSTRPGLLGPLPVRLRRRHAAGESSPPPPPPAIVTKSEDPHSRARSTGHTCPTTNVGFVTVP